MRQWLKFSLLVALVAMTAMPAFADSGCLIFSEYVEGSSYNKALELYNGTGSDIDGSRVTVELYSNGNTTVNTTVTLDGVVIPAGGTYVMVNPNSSAPLLALGDATYGGVANFNGDDYNALYLDGVLIDSIGQYGVDPGSYYGTDPCTTQNHTMRRMANICCGDTNNSDAFDPATEWDCYDIDDFSGLGSHTSNCVIIPTETSSWSSIKTRF
jgi:predicted extracellular nuclease